MTLLVTSGYLTLDDLVLGDGRVLRDVLGGGLSSPPSARSPGAARLVSTPARAAIIQNGIWSGSPPPESICGA